MLDLNQRPPPCKFSQSFSGRFCSVGVSAHLRGFAISYAVFFLLYPGVFCSGCSTFAASAWARNLGAPVRDFLHAETGGAVVLVGAALVALVWANSPWPRSYEAFWITELALSLNDHVLSTETCAGS